MVIKLKVEFPTATLVHMVYIEEYGEFDELCEMSKTDYYLKMCSNKKLFAILA